MSWILVVVISVLAVLLGTCIVGLILLVRAISDSLSESNRVIADHCSQFAYQMCATAEEQVDLAKTLEGDGENDWPKRRRFLRVTPDFDDGLMSSTEANID